MELPRRRRLGDARLNRADARDPQRRAVGATAHPAHAWIALAVLVQLGTALTRDCSGAPREVTCPAPRERAADPVGAAGAGARWSRVVGCDGRPHPGARELRGPARLLFGLKIDLNRADPALLEVLPGVGPARAAAIVSERERGCFRNLGELARVHGIGPATVRRLEPLLEVRAPCGATPALPARSSATSGSG